MRLSVLGVDPGAQTGVALLQVGTQASFRVTRQAAIAADDFPKWVRNLLQTAVVNVAAVETWCAYAGERGRKGASQTAYAVGRVVGALEALGVAEIMLLARPTILAGLGLRSNAGKEACQQTVALLTGQPDAEMNQHAADAIAAGIVGANRWGKPA